MEPQQTTQTTEAQAHKEGDKTTQPAKPEEKHEKKHEKTGVMGDKKPDQADKDSDDDEPKKEGEEDFEVTPYSFSNNTGKEIDYNKLIAQFGTKPITKDLLEYFEKVTGVKPHIYLRREIFFSHRDFNLFLKQFEEKKPLFLYTGRGPSSDAMHLGHLLPFIFTKWLQDTLKCPVVIQLTDDEKYFLQKPDEKNDIDHYRQLGYKNAKDIIAVGFDKERTFIFSDVDYIQHLYPNVCRFQRLLTYNQCKGIFGLKGADNCGRSAFPAIQAVPSFSSSFPHIFGDNKKVLCLIPQGIDQDPYFRMTRDVAERMKMKKPCCIHSKFLPGLLGFGTKMSSSDPNSVIFLTDTPAQIKNKINRYAFSGGQETEALQREKGANLEVDVAYHYLRFLLEDDAEIEEIGKKYSTGKMLTSEVKAILIEQVQKIVKDHQDRKAKITEAELKEWMSIRPLKLFQDGVEPAPEHKEKHHHHEHKEKGEHKEEKKEKKEKGEHKGEHKGDHKSKKGEVKPDEPKLEGEAPKLEQTAEKAEQKPQQ